MNALFLADESAQKGQREKAAAALLEGIKIYPLDQRLHFALAEIFIENKKFREALDILEKMPGGIDPFRGAAKKDIKKLELIGSCKEGMGLEEEALRYADEILAGHSSSPKAWNLKGSIAFKKGLSAEAEKYFTRAVEADKGFGEAYSNLGALQWMAGNKEKAFGLFEKAFILSPVSGDIVTNYYTAAVSLSRLKEAERVFTEAIALHPFNRKLKFILIDNLLQQRKHNEAMKTMEEAMDIFGIDDDTLNVALNLRDRVGPLEIRRDTKETNRDSVEIHRDSIEPNSAPPLRGGTKGG